MPELHASGDASDSVLPEEGEPRRNPEGSVRARVKAMALVQEEELETWLLLFGMVPAFVGLLIITRLMGFHCPGYSEAVRRHPILPSKQTT